MKNLLTLIVLLSLSVAAVYGGNNTSGTGLFLRLPVNARVAGLGEAYTAIASGVDAIATNVAGLGENQKTEFTFLYDNYIEDLSMQYFGVKTYIKRIKANIGLSIRNFDNGSFEGTLITGGYSYVSNGTFKAVDKEYVLSYMPELKNKVKFGLNVKYIKSEIAGETADGYAIDLGWKYKSNGEILPLNIGFAVQNIGKKLKFDSEKEDLPLTTRIGFSTELEMNKNINILGTIEGLYLNSQDKEKYEMMSGIEITYKSNYSIRMGYNTINEAGTGVSLGFGIKLKEFRFDYAYVDYGDLSSSNKISVNYSF